MFLIRDLALGPEPGLTLSDVVAAVIKIDCLTYYKNMVFVWNGFSVRMLQKYLFLLNILWQCDDFALYVKPGDVTNYFVLYFVFGWQ